MRQTCSADAECGTGSCTDLLGPPLSLGSGSTSCVRNEIVHAGPGTFDPASGALDFPLELRWGFHEGLDADQGCPNCSGPTLGAAGTCAGGPHDGEACRVDATDTLLGNVSYDFPPNPGAEFASLRLAMVLTTGVSRLEPSELCTAGASNGLPCYCSEQPVANDCINGDCAVGPDGDGLCVDGPIDGLCARESFRGCLIDAECPGVGDHCGARPRECSAEARRDAGNVAPLIRRGHADPQTPLLVSTFCVPPSASVGGNQALGLPGPAALRLPVRIEGNSE
jgi:hypothetical protein